MILDPKKMRQLPLQADQTSAQIPSGGQISKETLNSEHSELSSQMTEIYSGGGGSPWGQELSQRHDGYLNQVLEAPKAQVEVTKRQFSQGPELDLDLNFTPLLLNWLCVLGPAAPLSEP